MQTLSINQEINQSRKLIKVIYHGEGKKTKITCVITTNPSPKKVAECDDDDAQ
jgi:hypothetical protein